MHSSPLDFHVNLQKNILSAVLQIDGTVKMLEACLKAGDLLDRVVITSSAIAIQGGNEAPVPEQAFDEQTWTNLDKENSAYGKSKTMAEMAAWKFMKEKAPAFTLATCNPCFVIGPSIGKPRGTSAEIIRRFIKNELPGVPHFWFNHVDVRDVATAHLRAMVLPEAAGQRFLLVSFFSKFSFTPACLVGRSSVVLPLTRYTHTLTGSPRSGLAHTQRQDHEQAYGAAAQGWDLASTVCLNVDSFMVW